MCGLGLIASHPDNPLPVRVLSRLLLHDLAARGKHASGIAWKRLDGTTLYRKVEGHPVRLAAHLASVSGTRSLDDSHAVLVHTRYATNGDPSIPGNNHPVIRPGIALIHNGQISNAAQLYKIAKAPRMAEVDSDALAALVQTADDIPSLLKRLERILGSAAIAWLDVTDNADDATSVWVARVDTRPFVLGHVVNGGIVGASTEWDLNHVCRSAGVALKSTMKMPEGCVVRIVDGEIVEQHTAKTGSGLAESTIEYGGAQSYLSKQYDDWTDADFEQWYATNSDNRS